MKGWNNKLVITTLFLILVLNFYGCPVGLIPTSTFVNYEADMIKNKYLLDVAVVSYDKAHYDCRTYSPGSRGFDGWDVTVNTRNASLKLIRKVLNRMFETVQFFEHNDVNADKFDLVIYHKMSNSLDVKRIKTTRIQKSRHGVYDFGARTQYSILFQSPDGSYSETFSANGSSFDQKTIDEGFIEINRRRSWYPLGIKFDCKIVVAKSIESAFSNLVDRILASREVKKFAKKVEITKTLPANLIAEVQFSDKSSFLPNSSLDAGEKSAINVTLTNNGKGTAFDVKLNTDCDFPCVDFDKVIHIGDIPPGESKKLKVKLYGRLDLKDGTAPFLLQCKEKRGFDSEKIKLNIPTAHLEKPDIVIADYKINDGKTGLASGNGNGIPENGETVELTAFVKNNGVGRAIKVDLGIASIDSGVEVTRKQTEIAQILPGQTMSGKLAFVIPRTYSGGDIRVDLKASDVRGASDVVKQLALNLNTIRPVLAYSYNITDRNGNGFVENGETCELEIRVANKGQMEATGVSIKVDSADLAFSRNRAELDRLETGSANMPTRFSFTVPRTLEKESVDVEVQLTQAEFSGLTENINVPIKLSRPEFAISHQILDPNGNGVVEQGESIELVVRVKNVGQLDAADVNLGINIDQEGIILTSVKEFSIGRIQAGRESDPLRFMITVQRSVPAGDLPVSFNIAQKDFESRDLTLALNVAPEKAKEITVVGQRPASSYRQVSPAGRFKMAPHVVITTPRDGKRVVTNTVDLRGIAADDRGVVSIDINVNGRRIDLHDRGIAVKGGNTQREFYATVPLRTGRNEIVVTALDNENLTSEAKSITVFYEKEKGEVWAAVIGINDYRHVRKLDYARNDATAFADYLRTNLDIEADHLFELYDGQATKRDIQSLLGTQIRSKAGHEDTVIIFFAGHGAPEESETSLDGDGIDKYILPCDANTSDLYTTAIPMDEIARIFRRIKAERVILLADCCYSGQTGGRTILSKTRANISDAFLDRLSRGKGRIIITASSASEVSKESDDLKHGYFTYYLLKGLKGAADVDVDRFIDVNEISSYLNREVPKATGQKQHPVRKGEAEGQVVIGRIR